MRMPSRIVNPVLAVLLEGSGFTSLDEFAAAINSLGNHKYGLYLSYDHVGVKRWLSGGTCRQPEVVAEVLSRAWGIEIPVAVIWPQSRAGATPPAPHLVPCVAARTLDELAAYIGSDMLTRRALLTNAIAFTTGEALTDPLLRWLTGPAGQLPDRSAPTPHRLTMSTVARIEAATAAFGAQDAAIGGGLSREAAVGQLKHAVDLLRETSYTNAVGNRMLAAIAELAGMAGWMSHDVQMAGPAQRYFTLGLQAARESTDRRSALLQVSLLADMARQMRDLGHPATGLQLVDAALALLPRGRHPAAAAMLWNLRARMLGPLGPSSITELKHAIRLAEDLLADADPGDDDLLAYTGRAELAGNAALAWQDAAVHHPDLAVQAEEQALAALAARPPGYSRSTVFDQICVSAARFTGIDPDQAAADGHQAIDMAAEVATSIRVLDRLSSLLTHSAPHAARPAVRAFRERLTVTLRTAAA
ncbi:hypothetical protein [Micromonospora qiuiae]|nr:hypothetical protein [Micromonospora qiuiae]